MVTIIRPKGRPSQSANLRGVLTYHRTAKTHMQKISMLWDHAKGKPAVYFTWADGALCNTHFEDYTVLRAFVLKRTARPFAVWSGAEVLDILPPHTP